MSMSSEQLSPMQPSGHSQRQADGPVLTHVPPFWHGELLQDWESDNRGNTIIVIVLYDSVNTARGLIAQIYKEILSTAQIIRALHMSEHNHWGERMNFIQIKNQILHSNVILVDKTASIIVECKDTLKMFMVTTNEQIETLCKTISSSYTTHEECLP